MAQPNVANAAIQAASLYQAPNRALTSNMCKAPKQGMKFVTMFVECSNLTPTSNINWKIDLSTNSSGAGAPLEKISTLIIDASLSDRPLYIFFPDSGFSFTAAAFSFGIYPVISSLDVPIFYALLGPDFLTFATQELTSSPIDEAFTIIACNQYLPPMVSNPSVYNVPYTFGDEFTNTPVFSPVDMFTGTIAITTANTTSLSTTLINHQRWYITDMDIVLVGNTNDGNIVQYTATWLEGSTVRGTRIFLLRPEVTEVVLFKRNEMNFASANGNTMVLNITTGNPGNVTANVSYNLAGGILNP